MDFTMPFPQCIFAMTLCSLTEQMLWCFSPVSYWFTCHSYWICLKACGMKRDKVSTSLLSKFPCDVMIRCLYQSQHSMEDMKMGKKQAKSRHYTEKQKLTPNNLHLCIRNKGERIKGKEQERSQEIKTRRERKKRKKHHSRVGAEACTFHQRIKGKTEYLSAHGQGEGCPWGTDKHQACATDFCSASPAQSPAAIPKEQQRPHCSQLWER